MNLLKTAPRLCSLAAALLALSAPCFANEDEGRIVTVSPASITIGKKHPNTYKITTATAVTINGQSAAATALKPGMKADVVTEADVAKSITAKEDAPKGGADGKTKKAQ